MPQAGGAQSTAKSSLQTKKYYQEFPVPAFLACRTWTQDPLSSPPTSAPVPPPFFISNSQLGQKRMVPLEWHKIFFIAFVYRRWLKKLFEALIVNMTEQLPRDTPCIQNRRAISTADVSAVRFVALVFCSSWLHEYRAVQSSRFQTLVSTVHFHSCRW